MPHNNPGYDIESRRPDGHLIFIEVKGRIEGAEEFWVTSTEALHGKNSAAGSRLAMVSVSARPARSSTQVRYIVDPFRDVDFGDFAATGMIGQLATRVGTRGGPGMTGKDLWYKPKLIEVALPLEDINRRVGPGEVDPARAPVDAAPVVGATAARRVPGGAVRPACR